MGKFTLAFSKEDLSGHDVEFLIHILHDWNEKNVIMLKKN